MCRLVLACILCAVPQMAQTIEGTVTDSVTNQPLPGVKVAIDARGKAAGDALTDAQGAFRIEGLTPGEYTANFTRRGFQPPARDDASRRPFRLSTGNPVRLEARMTPLGKIGGRVLDATGAPVADANVQLFGGSLGYEETTDKQGKFSSDQVAPGSYVIWVHPPKNLKPPPARGGDRLAWAATFYPDGTDVTSAGKVQVRAGSEVWDLEVRLQPVPVHRLRGVVLDERGVPAPKVPVTLESNLALFGKPEDRETHAVSAEDGSFEFADASDGVWRLSAEADSSGTKLRAFTAETMAGHDLDRIQLRLSPPFAIHGSIVREAAAGVQIRKTPLLVLLTPEGGGSDFHQGRPDEEGLFAIAGIHPGRYVVRPIPPGPPFYLASMRLGDRELPLLEPIDLTSGALPLTIFYKSDGGGVRGTVENCGSATVIFFPQDPALQIPELERRATCGERGQFEIGAMRPGEYYGFAFDHAPGLDQMFFGFTLDRGLINQAARVTIRPGEFTTADLRVIPRP